MSKSTALSLGVLTAFASLLNFGRLLRAPEVHGEESDDGQANASNLTSYNDWTKNIMSWTKKIQQEFPVRLYDGSESRELNLKFNPALYTVEQFGSNLHNIIKGDGKFYNIKLNNPGRIDRYSQKLCAEILDNTKTFFISYNNQAVINLKVKTIMNGNTYHSEGTFGTHEYLGPQLFCMYLHNDISIPGLGNRMLTYINANKNNNKSYKEGDSIYTDIEKAAGVTCTMEGSLYHKETGKVELHSATWYEKENTSLKLELLVTIGTLI